MELTKSNTVHAWVVRRAKADLKAATDPFVKGVLDGRQLALKVPCSVEDHRLHSRV